MLMPLCVFVCVYVPCCILNGNGSHLASDDVHDVALLLLLLLVQCCCY